MRPSRRPPCSATRSISRPRCVGCGRTPHSRVLVQVRATQWRPGRVVLCPAVCVRWSSVSIRRHGMRPGFFQMQDLADKIESAEGQLTHFGRGSASYIGQGAGERTKKDDSQVRPVVARVSSTPAQPARPGCACAAQEDCQGLVQDWPRASARFDAAGDEGCPLQPFGEFERGRHGHVMRRLLAREAHPEWHSEDDVSNVFCHARLSGRGMPYRTLARCLLLEER